MSRSHPLFQLTAAKLREMLREPEMIFWVFVFPLLLAGALGIAFRSSGPEVLPVAVVEGEGAERLRSLLDDDAGLAAVVLTQPEAERQLRNGGRVVVVVPGSSWTYWYDPTRPESARARLLVNDVLQRSEGRSDPRAVATREMTERGSRYIDFLVPGLLGMNLMGTGMWGIGYYIVNARSKRLLKQLMATPMRRSHYLLSQMAGRLLFLVVEVGVLLLFANLALDVPIRGSIGAIALVSVIGALTFAGLGLVVASRPRTVEGVSGLMNAVQMPMWILSGIFFSTSRFPDVIQPLVQALPLTAINDALRAVLIDGAPLLGVWHELAIAVAWGIVAFVGALVGFRWQ